jgi:carbamate kinase
LRRAAEEFRCAGQLKGSEAVIDKDRCSALLATDLGAELLVFSTGVTYICLHFGKPSEKPLFHLSWEEARTYLKQGEFAAGSMRTKVKRHCDFWIPEGGERSSPRRSTWRPRWEAPREQRLRRR